MNVDELLALTNWIDAEITGKRILEAYRALYEVLAYNMQNPTKQPFETQRTQLYDALRAVEVSRLSVDQLHFLTKLGITGNVGEVGVAAVEDALVKNPIDIGTATHNIKRQLMEVTQGVEKATAIKNSLTSLVDPPRVDNAVLVRVAFTGGAAMKNIVDFKKWGVEWYDIGRGIAMASGIAPEEIRVVGAKNGSIVIELAVALVVARLVSAIILESLKVAERILEIRKQAEVVRSMKLANDKIALDLENEAESLKSAEVERIVQEVVADLKLQATKEGDKVNALTSSVKKMVGFVEKGGEVDCVVPDDKAMGDGEETQELRQEIAQLRASLAEIRALESRVKRLPGGGPQQQA